MGRTQSYETGVIDDNVLTPGTNQRSISSPHQMNDEETLASRVSLVYSYRSRGLKLGMSWDDDRYRLVLD